MSKRILLTIEYDGSAYCGWQRQLNGPSVQQKVEEALREEEERFRTLFDQSPDPSSIVEGHLMVKANSAARRVFGQHPGENQGFHPAQLSPEYQPDGLLSQQKAEHMMTIAQARGSHRFEWIHLRGDGTPFFTEVTLIAVTMRGKPTIHAVVHDISERKQAEEALQTSRNLLQAIIESAGALIYVFDRDERLLVTIAVVMKPTGEDLLPNTGFAKQQDVDGTSCRFGKQIESGSETCRGPDQSPVFLPLAQLST